MNKKENNPDINFGLNDTELIARFNIASKMSVEKNKTSGAPIARYDSMLKKPYMENSDGSRKY